MTKGNQGKRLVLRIGEEAKAELFKRAAERDLSVSEYVRRLVGGIRSVPLGTVEALRKNRRELVKLRRELNAIGVNFNQLVALMHSRRIHTTEGTETTIQELAALYESAVEDVDTLRELIQEQVLGSS